VSWREGFEAEEKGGGKEMDGKDNGNPTLNTFPILTRREAKGYCFEIEVQNILYTLGFKFQGNPVSEYAWKHDNIHHKVDVVLANGLRIECKNIDAKIYLSWFKRDWLPKGSCVFVFKGDLKLSPAIIEQYHPILLHYSLLHVYLNYNLPLFRGVTSLYKANIYLNIYSNILAKKYLTKTLELDSSEEKIPTENVELSVSRSSEDTSARREHRHFHYNPKR
jgi:hypothetical protein